MAQRVIAELVDDIDGTKADQTVEFSLDGVLYEIDLTDTHADKLREGLQDWIQHSRRTGGRLKRRISGGAPAAAVTGATKKAGRAAKGSKAIDPGAVREWARAQGKRVSDRGRVPGWLIEEYKAAH